MSLIDLTKKVQIVLEKRNLPNPPVCRVGMAIDGSGSMKPLYRTGVVQRAVDRLLAVASRFDDDGNLDGWLFDENSHELDQATPASYGGYVQNAILPRYRIDGGTSYAPVLEDIGEFYFPAPEKRGLFSRLFGRGETPVDTSSQPPAFVMMVTDGENDDKAETVGLLKDFVGRGLRIYFQMVGIGSERFRFLQTVSGDLPNVGFCKVDDIAAISDEDLYERILSQEFVDWVRA